MPNYKRYEVCSSWLLDHDYEHEADGVRTLVVVETADLRDKRTGDLFREGAWRVRFARVVASATVKPPYKTKTWFGETAWDHAQRYALDSLHALRLGREVPAR